MTRLHRLLNHEVPDALDVVERVLQKAITSGAHNPGDWRSANNKTRLANHMVNYTRRQQRESSIEDDLANLVCRGLFLIQLREEAHQERRSKR